MTAAPAARPGWDVSFLRWAALVTAGVAGLAAAVAFLLAGWPEAAGVLTGAAVVAAFFSLSALVIAWAGRIDDALTLPAALGAFLVKALVFFAVLQSLPADGVPDRLATAWAVVAGTAVWAGVHIRWVLTRKLYYVTPPEPPGTTTSDPALRPPAPPSSDPALRPPAPPSSDPALRPPAPPSSDPEKPTTRG